MTQHNEQPTIAPAPVRKEKPPVWLILGIVTMLVLAVLSSSTATNYLKSWKYEGVPAPEVILPVAKTPGGHLGMAGEPVKLSSFKGKVLLLDFWATWCGPCRKQLPIVNQLAKDESLQEQLQVITINVDEYAPDRVANVEAYMRMKKYGLLTLLDDGSAQQAYQISSIPTLVIVGPSGNVHKLMYGVHDDTKLRALIQEAAAL